jgi:hypothetical protein
VPDRGAFRAGAAIVHDERAPAMPLAASSGMPVKEMAKSNKQKQVNKTRQSHKTKTNHA